jgi:hypothetical protein
MRKSKCMYTLLRDIQTHTQHQQEAESISVWNMDEDAYLYSKELENGTPRDATLSALIPGVDQDELRKRYLKYRHYSVNLITYAQLHGLAPEETAAPVAHVSSKRELTQEQVQRHRHAIKAGSSMPSKARPSQAMVASKLHFSGPILRRVVQAPIVKQDSDRPGGDSNEQSSTAADHTNEKKSELQRKRVAVPLPDFRPKAPKMPDKVCVCI